MVHDRCSVKPHVQLRTLRQVYAGSSGRQQAKGKGGGLGCRAWHACTSTTRKHALTPQAHAMHVSWLLLTPGMALLRVSCTPALGRRRSEQK